MYSGLDRGDFYAKLMRYLHLRAFFEEAHLNGALADGVHSVDFREQNAI
jgi:hypothetical protein